MRLLFLLVTVFGILQEVWSHGLLVDPPARNYMGMLGFDVPINYDTMGLNCGGFANQWNNNDGKCGICGDPYQGPRLHEPKGPYATPIIGRCYPKGIKSIEVTVRIPAYHKGYFEFRLCHNNNPKANVTQECLDMNHLAVSGTGVTRYDINFLQQLHYTFHIDLPEGLECTQCVLQWKYNTGNSWGCDENFKCGVGFGPQEQFINCADVAVLPDCTNVAPTHSPTVTYPPWGSSFSTTSTLVSPSDDTPLEQTITIRPGTTPVRQRKTTFQLTTIRKTSGIPTSQVTNKRVGIQCKAADIWVGNRRMDKWCMTNCLHDPPYCPITHCTCTGSNGESKNRTIKICVPTAAWSHVPGFSSWCNLNCNWDKPNCPPEHCTCY
ncbi:hypothetical protein CHS0354_042468 [Potamilus streckersoni]|uniref:Chitin-binding type-4 domain-containing protein n=1 Tax=Potamilus streckersoni TaxID=2493646 RepID=A0AAE0VRN8_9BIVA|nr:hypothetical protein CHS0354_042468 [Potamilus streckersoni]